MSGLERRYRDALRWYPRSWRAQNGEIVLSTLLDAADAAGRSRPAARETADLAVHGTLMRMRMLGAAVPAPVRDRVSAVSFGTALAVVLVGLLFTELAPLLSPPDPAGSTPQATFGPVASPGVIIYGLWIAGFVAAMLGRTRVSRVLVLLTIPASAGARIASEFLNIGFYPTATLMCFLGILSIFVASGRPGASRRGIATLGITSTAAVAVAAIALVATIPLLHVSGTSITPAGAEAMFSAGRGYFLQGFLPVLACAIPAALASSLVLVYLRRGVWAATTALSAVPWIVLALFGFRDLVDLVDVAAITAAVTAAVAVVAVALRAGGVRITITRA